MGWGKAGMDFIAILFLSLLVMILIYVHGISVTCVIVFSWNLFAGVGISVNRRCSWFHWHINFSWEGVLVRYSPRKYLHFILTCSIAWTNNRTMTCQSCQIIYLGDCYCSYIVRYWGISWTSSDCQSRIWEVFKCGPGEFAFLPDNQSTVN